MSNKSRVTIKEIEARLLFNQEESKRKLLKEIKQGQYSFLDWFNLLVGGFLICSGFVLQDSILRDFFLGIGILCWIGLSQKINDRRINALVRLLNLEK